MSADQEFEFTRDFQNQAEIDTLNNYKESFKFSTINKRIKNLKKLPIVGALIAGAEAENPQIATGLKVGEDLEDIFETTTGIDKDTREVEYDAHRRDGSGLTENAPNTAPVSVGVTSVHHDSHPVSYDTVSGNISTQ